MKIKDLSSYNREEVMSLLARIPFYRELQQGHQPQLDKILAFSCVVELEPGEVIMRRGDKGSWLYFLIKGRLAVYFDEGDPKPLNYITPGELFGDLALLCNHERKATVAAAAEDGKKALLFATDFKPFGELDNFTTVDLSTKLIFYRIMVHSIRWRLEVNRMEQPTHPLAEALRKVPIIRAEKGSVEELHGLHQQAQFLAGVLDRWNSGSARGVLLEDVVVASPATQN